MSFWSDKMAEMQPARPAQPQARPATWWQPAQSAPARPLAAPGPAQQTEGVQGYPDYAPTEAAHLNAEEHCPRCGSEEYTMIPIDLSYGGRGGMAETGVNLSQHKQCFDCRYPSRNPSGEVVRSGGIQVEKADRRKVRQIGNGDTGSWRGQETFDSAPLIA